VGGGGYDDAVKRSKVVATARAHCAHCHREIIWHGNPHRPFCSVSCRLIDLGVWLDERYRIAGARAEATLHDDDAADSYG
jgi:endogenous inhibitor of DNA gyrase (YacG/DUF329 family)